MNSSIDHFFWNFDAVVRFLSPCLQQEFPSLRILHLNPGLAKDLHGGNMDRTYLLLSEDFYQGLQGRNRQWI